MTELVKALVQQRDLTYNPSCALLDLCEKSLVAHYRIFTSSLDNSLLSYCSVLQESLELSKATNDQLTIENDSFRTQLNEFRSKG